MIQINHLKISTISNFCILIEGERYKSFLSRYLSCIEHFLKGSIYFCNLFQFFCMQSHLSLLIHTFLCVNSFYLWCHNISPHIDQEKVSKYNTMFVYSPSEKRYTKWLLTLCWLWQKSQVSLWQPHRTQGM